MADEKMAHPQVWNTRLGFLLFFCVFRASLVLMVCLNLSNSRIVLQIPHFLWKVRENEHFLWNVRRFPTAI